MSPGEWETGILVLARNCQFGLIPGHVKIKGKPYMFYSGWTLSWVYPHWSYSPCKILAGSSDSYLLAVVFSHKVNPLNFLAYWRDDILKYNLFAPGIFSVGLNVLGIQEELSSSMHLSGNFFISLNTTHGAPWRNRFLLYTNHPPVMQSIVSVC